MGKKIDTKGNKEGTIRVRRRTNRCREDKIKSKIKSRHRKWRRYKG